MNRRQLIGSTAAVPLTVVASFIRAYDHAGHACHTGHAGHAHSAPRVYETAHKAVVHCAEAGQICLAHCIASLSEGDTFMKDYTVGVNQILALCGTLQNLAAQGSHLTPSLVKVCIEACKQRFVACKEHTGHHAECKACHEFCLACTKECGKIAA